MGIKEMTNYRKQSVRDSLQSKGSINEQLFSSIGSGPILGKLSDQCIILIGQNIDN